MISEDFTQSAGVNLISIRYQMKLFRYLKTPTCLLLFILKIKQLNTLAINFIINISIIRSIKKIFLVSLSQLIDKFFFLLHNL